MKRFCMAFIKHLIVTKDRLNKGTSGFWTDCVAVATGELTMNGQPHGMFKLEATTDDPDMAAMLLLIH